MTRLNAQIRRRTAARVTFALAMLLMAAGSARAQTTVVRERTFQHAITLRAEVVAQKESPIINPIQWASIAYVAPDGGYVTEGEVITRFEREGIEDDLQRLRIGGRITSATVRRDLSKAENTLRDLEDELAELEDRRAILEARQERLQSLPLEDEVRIEEGRLRVAELNHEAAEKEYDRARKRYENGMISPAALEEYERTFREREAGLQYARQSLAYTRLPATDLTLRRVGLELDNVRLEIDKVRKELERNRTLTELQVKSGEAKMQITRQRIDEREEDLRNTEVRAPASGYVVYTSQFMRELQSNGKFFKNFNYMNMPDLSSLALKALMPETDRQFYVAGDPVAIRLATEPERIYAGRILSFSKLPHDISEKDKADFEWGKTQDGLGIKVYDLTVAFDERPDWVRPGMHAVLDVRSTRTVTHAALPMGFVKPLEGRYYVSLDGRYTQVKGRPIGAWFALDDRALLGREVSMFGRLDDRRERTAAEPGGRFSVSGELVPVQTADVFVRHIYRFWGKVTWLAEEDIQVEPGDVVARLDTKEIDDELQTLESRVKDAESARDSTAERRELLREQNAFVLARAENQLEIARIDWELTDLARDWPALFAAELDLAQARIALEDIQRRLERVEAREVSSLSPMELRRLHRNAERRKLERERAEIRLAELQRGADRLERSRARLDYDEQHYQTTRLTLQAELDSFHMDRDLEQADLDLKGVQKRFERRRSERANTEIKAPAAGLLRYAKIFNQGSVSKVKVGSDVAERFTIMKVADVSEMFLRVQIPEKYASRVAEGMDVQVRLSSEGGRTLPGTISQIELLFEERKPKDSDVGLYSSHERLGETVFHARVVLPPQRGGGLKPGTLADVIFPFER